ncbi:hypothetical protein SK128_009816 [Halocaridina rubra]|uniref:C2H2-type domain-containing protein n=1 Tax=Halocaridina rubra TaxID=373956 RepID=A0AAN8WSS0_HALRR
MDQIAPHSGAGCFNNNPLGDIFGGSHLSPMELGGLEVGGMSRQFTSFVQYPSATATSQVPLVNGGVQYVQATSNISLLEEGHIAHQSAPSDTKVTSKVRPALGEKITCEICSATFACGANLRNHLRIHSGERPYVCEECGASFTQRSNLRSHKRVHTGERPYMCGICGQRFARSSHLPGHMRTHTGEKPFNCPHCGRSFATNQIMKNHMRTHTGERPFMCKVCYATFAQSSCLATHRKIHTGERNFKCNNCGKAFISRSGLQTHFRVHTGEKPYTCEKCDKSFKTSSYLSKHKQKYCGNSGFKSKLKHHRLKKNERKVNVKKIGKSIKVAKSPSLHAKSYVSKRIRRSRRYRGLECEKEIVSDTDDISEVKGLPVKGGEVVSGKYISQDHEVMDFKAANVLDHCTSQENQDPLDEKFIVGSSHDDDKFNSKNQQYDFCDHPEQLQLDEHCLNLEQASNLLTREFLASAEHQSDEHSKPTVQVMLDNMPLQIPEEQQQHSFLSRNGEP